MNILRVILGLVLCLAQYVWNMDTFSGPYCEKLALSIDKLNDPNTHIEESSVTNGLVLELKHHYGTLKEAVLCLQSLNSTIKSVHAKTINSRVLKIVEIKKKLQAKKKVKGYRNLTEFLDEQVIFHSAKNNDVSLHIPPRDTCISTDELSPQEIDSSAPVSLCEISPLTELHNSRCEVPPKSISEINKSLNLKDFEIRKKEKHLAKLEGKVCETQEKLKTIQSRIGHFSVRNINKREEAARQKIFSLRHTQKYAARKKRHLEVKVRTQKEAIEGLQQRVKELTQEASKINEISGALANEKKKKHAAQKTTSYWRIKANKLQKQDVTDSHSVIQDNDKNISQEDSDLQLIEDYLKDILVTKTDNGSYTDNLRLCVIELASLEVATEKISPVITAVINHMLGHELKKSELPNKTTTQNIVDEGHYIAKTYISQRLENTENWGLQRDGTSRKKKKLLDTSVTLSTGEVVSLGFSRVANETAKAIHQVTKQHFEELSVLSSINHNAANVQPEQVPQFIPSTLEKLAFTMSDRASNEKLADRLLNEWRDNVLNRCQREEEVKSVHSFHCMAHVLLGFHRYACKDLKDYEKDLAEKHGPLGRDSLPQFKFWKKSETVVERVVRTTSDTFGPVGDYLGLRDRWEAHCKTNGIKSIIGNYKDNRFNALFQTAAEVFVHRKSFLEVLETVEKPNNKLLSVKVDLQDENIVLLLQSLGLFYVKVTAPYWNMVTTGQVPYLKLYTHIQSLRAFLQLCTSDPANLLNMEGHWTREDPFEFSRIPHHLILRELFNISEDSRDILLRTIKVVSTGMLNTIEKQLVDFLPEGKYAHEANDEELKRTSFGHVTNLGCEHHFGDLDSSQRRRPNSSLHHHSSVQMLKRNRSGIMNWLSTMNPDVRQNVMKSARKEGKVLRKKHLEMENNVVKEIQLGMNAVVEKKKTKKRKTNSNHTERESQRWREDDELDYNSADQHILPKDMCFKENAYVAVAYQDSWYPGIVTKKINDKTAIVKFMSPCAKSGIFKWPSRDDIQEVDIEFVLKDDLTPECENSGRQWFFKCWSDIEKVYDLYSALNF